MAQATPPIITGILVWHPTRAFCTVDPSLAVRLSLTTVPGRQECEAKAFFDRIHAEDRERVIDELQAIFQTADPFVTTFRMYGAADAILMAQQIGWWIRDDDGEPVSLVTQLSLAPETSPEARTAFARAAAMIRKMHLLAIDEGWRDMQYMADVMKIRLAEMERDHVE